MLKAPDRHRRHPGTATPPQPESVGLAAASGAATGRGSEPAAGNLGPNRTATPGARRERRQSALTCPLRDSAGWQVLAGQRPHDLRRALPIRIIDALSGHLMTARPESRPRSPAAAYHADLSGRSGRVADAGRGGGNPTVSPASGHRPTLAVGTTMYSWESRVV